jgi:hypothetical protein
VVFSGGSALPLFAEFFELGDELVHFWPRETIAKLKLELQ